MALNSNLDNALRGFWGVRNALIRLENFDEIFS